MSDEFYLLPDRLWFIVDKPEKKLSIKGGLNVLNAYSVDTSDNEIVNVILVFTEELLAERYIKKYPILKNQKSLYSTSDKLEMVIFFERLLDNDFIYLGVDFGDRYETLVAIDDTIDYFERELDDDD